MNAIKPLQLGGTFDIQPPEIETKLGIVKSFVEEYKVKRGNSRTEHPRRHTALHRQSSSSNIRELKKRRHQGHIPDDLLQPTGSESRRCAPPAGEPFSGGPSKRLTIADIQKEVENFYKISHAELIGKKRTRNIIYARQIGIFCADRCSTCLSTTSASSSTATTAR